MLASCPADYINIRGELAVVTAAMARGSSLKAAAPETYQLPMRAMQANGYLLQLSTSSNGQQLVTLQCVGKRQLGVLF